MRPTLQRVSSAVCRVDGRITGQIDKRREADLPIGKPISRSACGNQEIATRAPVCAAYQTGESPVQSHVKLCS